ncbi:MAG: hypothetical protein Q8L48_44375 [Archangium sp.]|nr:hypothetical protein [Archangium sp.]
MRLRRRYPRPKYDAALPTLRWRTARLIARLPPKTRALVRLVPLLLDARFRRPSLDMDPPGLLQPPRRRRWGRLCEQLDLPPPMSWSQHRPLIESVVLAPTPGGGFELLIIPLGGLGPLELQRVSRRTDAIAQLAGRHAPELEVRMAGPAELTPSLFAWAAVIAGDVPHLPPSPGLDWHDAFARAPTALLRCLMLLVRSDAPSPLSLMRATRVPSSAPGFLACWSASPVAEELTLAEGKTLAPAALEGLARRFRTACLRALRAFPVRDRRSLRAVLGPALLGRRIPPVLRPWLERTLQSQHPRELQHEDGWTLELEGLVLARARSLDQLRALALTESSRLAPGGHFWPRLSAAVEARAPRALVLIEPGFLRHLVVFVPASGRPRARRVDATGVLRFALTWHHAGVPVELLPAPGSEPTLVARVSQLLAISLRPDEAVGFQLGKKVLLVERTRTRVLTVARALARPRHLTWLPEQAEMARALRRPLATGLPTIQLVAFPEGEEHAALFALDSRGAIYRELVLRTELEPTLQELREVLRQADPPSLLAASVHPLLTSLAGRGVDPQPAVSLHVSMTARGDQAVLDGERFGSGAPLAWSALAEAVLSQWPPGTWAHVGVDRVNAPVGTSALELLAARSRVLRRLDTHLRRISRHLRAA